MKLAHIRIKNVLGIDYLEFSPEGFTEISGQNGSGKSSFLEAIKSATGQGHDATLLRKGAEKGEVVLVLDDGTEIQERITASGTTRNVVRDGKKLTRPADTIKALTDALSVNPVEFLTARKQDRVKVLLESMPIELDEAKLSEVSGIPVKMEPGANALAVIDFVRQQVYDDRTGTNRAVKEKEATINQLRAAMPDAPGGVDGDEDALQQQIETARQTRDNILERITTKITGIRTAATEKVDQIRAKLQADIDALREAAQKEVDAINADKAENETKAAAARDNANEKFNQTTTPLNAALTAIRANRDAAAKRKGTQETIEQMQEELSDLRKDAESQSNALDAIDQFKSDLLANLPIPGIEIRDGEIYRDGVMFDRLNTAQRVGIAFDIAKLRAGNLRLCCLDGMELLDSNSLAEIQKQASDSDMQVFVTRVKDEEFSVETQ